MTDRDLVIGLDSSTQSCKAVAWSREGQAVAEGRAAIPLSTPGPGLAEQDPRDWWSAACDALKTLHAKVDPARIAGLAISNQRETVALVDADLAPLRPAIVWLDERAREDIAIVSDALGADRLHRETGKYPNLTPVIYRLNWLRRNEPQLMARAVKILDVHGYLTGRLTGAPTASWTSADPFGVFDIAEKRWSAPILDWLDLEPSRFAAVLKPGGRVGEVSSEAARETGLPPGTPVFAGGGDGQCAGVGVDGARPGVVCLNLGTAVITAAWAAEPRVSAYWRTMTSPTGEGYFLEGCQRAGTFFVDWFVDTFAGGRDASDRAALFARLEKMASEVPIGSEGATVSPHLTGCMDPHWDPDARASFSGLGAHHGLAHLYRAAMEALTLECARCVDAMRGEGLKPERIVAVGGGASSPLWRKMLADATGLPLALNPSVEASSAGAAMAAAAGCGWYSSIAEAASAMAPTGEITRPDPSDRAAWDALSARQAAAYRPGG